MTAEKIFSFITGKEPKTDFDIDFINQIEILLGFKTVSETIKYIVTVYEFQ